MHVETARAAVFDPYRKNRITGSAILIDPVTNATAGALMIRSGGCAHREFATGNDGRARRPVRP